MIAALYVHTDGIYFGLDDVDPWDEERDARQYDGPWPVVAHPPCAAWSSYAAAREACFGLPAGEDDGCFAAALEAVRRFGGVLEHPAGSAAWAAFGLPRPTVFGAWEQTLLGEWVAEIDQAAYGNNCRKPTWLYYVGESPPAVTRDERSLRGARGCDDLTSKARALTAPVMRDYLLSLAQACRPTDSDCASDEGRLPLSLLPSPSTPTPGERASASS